MREIKFRAWDKIDEIMHDVVEINFGNWIAVPHQADVDEWELSQLEWDDIELIEFTGLKDKNGVPIYEGDVVRLNDYHMVVKWDEGKCGWDIDKCPAPGYVQTSLEVIGNIYQNPELLEVK